MIQLTRLAEHLQVQRMHVELWENNGLDKKSNFCKGLITNVRHIRYSTFTCPFTSTLEDVPLIHWKLNSKIILENVFNFDVEDKWRKISRDGCINNLNDGHLCNDAPVGLREFLPLRRLSRWHWPPGATSELQTLILLKCEQIMIPDKTDRKLAGGSELVCLISVHRLTQQEAQNCTRFHKNSCSCRRTLLRVKTCYCYSMAFFVVVVVDGIGK